MKHLHLLVLLGLLVSGCGDDSPTGPSDNTPACCWSRAGSGDTVFDMPRHVQRVRITGNYTANSSNFIVRVDGSLIVNELLGTSWGRTQHEGTYLVGDGGVVEITNSSGVQWTFTEVR